MKKEIKFPSAVELNTIMFNSKLREKINNAAKKIAAKHLSKMAIFMTEEANHGEEKFTYRTNPPEFTDDINIAASIEKIEPTALYNAVLTIIMNTLKDNGYNYTAKSNNVAYKNGQFDVSITASWATVDMI